MKKRISLIIIIFYSIFAFAQERRGIQQHRTFETQNFIIHYEQNLARPAGEIATILERVHGLFRDKYSITLPARTNVIVANSAFSGGWALALQNTIGIYVNELDWNMRGSANWLENVVIHEYSHIVSIANSFKLPSWMPYFQFGKFSHPNEKNTAEIMASFPQEILPPWFFEGIAQFDSYRLGGDRWDSHRDMIMRTLSLSDSLLSWDRMSVFTGRGDDFEKVYNHGFLLVRFIAETHGEDKIAAILRESSRFGRLVFDNSVKAVLGISGRQLFEDFKRHIRQKYNAQIGELGEITEARKLTPIGFDNFWPRFSNDDNKILFLSNGPGESFFKMLHAYDLSANADDTASNTANIAEADSAKSPVRLTAPHVNNQFSLDSHGNIFFMSSMSLRSRLPHNRGGEFVFDIHRTSIPSDTTKRALRESVRESEQLTFAQNLLSPAVSPCGQRIAAVAHRYDRHFLVIGNADGSNFETVYPPINDETLAVRTIYSLDWSSDGENIAMSYMDRDFRKIGIFNVRTNSFSVLSDNTSDDRDPRFSRDGKTLYFASDRTGIFNIFRKSGDLVEQLTNVAGGAFTPDVNSDETQLVFASYTSDGFKIFKTEISPPQSPYQDRAPIILGMREPLRIGAEFIGGKSRNYSYFPRQLLVIPTVLSEELITQRNNINQGISHTKYGVIVGLNDPLFWMNKGNMLTVFYLTDNIFRQISSPFTDMSRNFLVAFDWGLMYETQKFPVDLSLSFFRRNIPIESDFVHNIYGFDTLSTVQNSIQPSQLQVSASKSVLTRFPTNRLTLGGFASHTNFRQQVRIDENEGDRNMLFLWFDPAKLTRLGTWISYGNTPRYTSSQNISPKGFKAQFQWDFNSGQYASEEEVIIIEDGKIRSNNQPYNFNSYRLSLFWGSPSRLISDRVDFALRFNASVVHETRRTARQIAENHARNPYAYPADLPDFFLPAVHVPGYSFSFRADSSFRVIEGSNGRTDTITVSEDSLTASNKVLLELHSSYRFPLTGPRGIGRKWWIFYFDKLYGAVNFGGALPANSLSALRAKTIDDALIYAGPELRLSTFIFNMTPLAMSVRYDYGFNRRSPVGGGRISFSLGWDFNNRTIISTPDGNRFTPAVLRGKTR